MATSNAAGISLPESAVLQMQSMLRHIDRLTEIIDKSRKLEPGITIFQILRPLAEELKLPYSDLENIFFALENLKSMGSDFGSLDEAIARIEAATPQKLSEQLRKNISKINEIVSSYTNNPVSITVKAQKLTYYYEHVLRNSEILTDARPVFDEDGESILEFLVLHSLVLVHTASGRTERIHLAMDASDVLSLRKACDRAIRKGTALKKALGSPDHKWKVQVLRDSDAT